MQSFKSDSEQRLGRIEPNHVRLLKHSGRTFVRSESESARQYTLPACSSGAIQTWTPVESNWQGQPYNTHKTSTAALEYCHGLLVQKVR